MTLSGEVLAFEDGVLTIETPAGETVHINVPESVRVTGLKQVDFAQLKKGDYIASAANAEENDVLTARDVRIFPEALRGVAEGHFPYPGGEGSTMTNATIDAVAIDGEGGQGGSFKVMYKGGGEKVIVVPEGVPVMQMMPGNQDQLVEGAYVTIFGMDTPDMPTASRIGVGLDGLKPPS